MARQRYVPQFDGIRALAISAVIAYHLGYLPGGWVGVDVFFVLSGYLITGLLLAGNGPQRDLGRFWGRRAKRLLPAVLVLLVALSVYAWAGGVGLVPAQLRAPALATLFYVANWQQIVAGHGYFARYLSVSPLQQTWSLAIEEQYYLVWPVLLLAMAGVTRRRPGLKGRTAMLAFTVVLAVASAIWMGVAAHLYGANRAYLGTDTRAWELLVGGAAAMVWPRGEEGRSRNRSTTWSVVTALGLAGVAVGAAVAGGPPSWIWEGGLVAIAACATVVVVGVTKAGGGAAAQALAFGPLRWVGLISYSLYLWHWPVIVLITPATVGWSGWPLLLARLGTMVALSCASYYVVERPLRRADWTAWARRMYIPTVAVAVVGIATTAMVIVAGTIGPPPATSGQVAAAPTSETTGAASFRFPAAAPGKPWRAWIFGDSVMVDSSLGITAALQATQDVSVVLDNAVPGWGLSTDNNRLAEVANILAQSHPQVAIGFWSWDDQRALANPVAYRTELEQFLATMLTPSGGLDLVALVQFPRPGPDDSITDAAARLRAWKTETANTDAWNVVARQAVAAFPGHALFLATDQLFAPGGRFLTWMRTPLGTWLRARKLDNTHMCPYGAASFGALVTQELTPVLNLGSLRPGWESGPWTRDARYNDPPGACPDDQPPAGYRGITVPKVARDRMVKQDGVWIRPGSTNSLWR